jgi:DNA-binding transcriptional MerR regulator
MAADLWRIGELARVAGISVRTLHHYEASGLLAPTSRTAAGHRLYSARDVRRLYLILALRSLGLGLSEIASAMQAGASVLPEVVRRHRRHVEQQLASQERLRLRLQFIEQALDRGQEPGLQVFVEAMEAMRMFERYFTHEQLSQLEERRRDLGDDAIARSEQQWADLIGEAEAARAAGLDPASPEVQALWRRWQDLIQQFTGGDPTIFRSLQSMYAQEGAPAASRGSVNTEVMDYMARAGKAAER